MSSEPEVGDPLVGRALGDFVLEERIGEGSYGAVYRAKQPLLGRLAAVKILHTRLAAEGEATDRFLREARTASSLDHPYAAHIYSSGAEADGLLWIAMEYVRGTPFSAYLHAHGALPLERFIPFLERICEVVHSAHEQGIVHRDLKPANIMVLSRAGRLLPKLLDFGIAKAIAATEGGAAPAAAEPASAEADGLDPASLAQTLPPQRGAAPTGMPAPSGTPAPSGSGGRGLRGGGASALADAFDATRPSSEELTRRGDLIGSPYYMAPEQWDDAASVDARSDLYAVGVLAYEALTGTRPLSGKSMREIAYAHRTAAPPAVPEGLPRALDDVFAIALAKSREERYGDALALAAAFRRGAELGGERPPLPGLAEPARTQFLTSAPQPLAEAVATLDSTREPRQARDALWAITDTLAHYLGVLALCARSRFGAKGGEAIPAALRRAGLEVLTSENWLEIGEALTKAHAERPDLHPIPELVQFFSHGEEAPEDGAGAFRALWRLREPLASAAASEDALRARLGEAVAKVSALLSRAAFVCDYPLALPDRGGAAAGWSGVRRAPRPAFEIRGPALAPGEPTLVGADGAPVLSLYPLVQALPPANGAPPELFLFAGGAGRGGVLVAPPHAFERRDLEVLDWLRLQLETTLDSRGAENAGERAPYRGLEAYTADDATLYVGREREIDGFANRLQTESLLVVVGPSGAGKSSFVQAGVVPALHERDETMRVISLRPGSSPLAALTSRLVAAGFAAAGLAARLRSEPDLLGELLREDGAARGTIVLFVDQLEEIFTLTKDEDERQAFVAALAGAARAGAPVRVVATLRDDFLLQAEALPALRDRLAHSLKLLTTPGPEELERVLVEPARSVGYEFEDSALPGRMVAEVAGEPGALALLSFTASKLWEARDRHFRRLPTRAYDELGGVGGALATHAEALLESLPQTERRLVREAFRLLVTGGGTRAVLGREELVTALGGGPAAEAAIEHLVSGRLLVVSEGEDGEQIEVTHEALLTSWPRLVNWRREDTEGARLRDQLRAAAVQWDRRGRPRGLLWRDDALAEYQIWRARYPGALTQVENDFGRESLAVAKRGKRQRQALVTAAFAALAAGLAVLFVMHQRAEDARAEVSRQLLDSYLEQGSQALQSDRYYDALLFLTEAYEMGARGSDLEFMLSAAAAPFDAQLATARHDSNIWDVRFSPDGDRLAVATSDGRGYLRDGRDGALLHELSGHDDEMFRAAWSPDGRYLASSSSDRTVRVWDPKTGDEARILDHGTEAVYSLAFDPSGARLVTGSFDGRVRIFRDWEEVEAMDAHRGRVRSLAMNPGGELFATGGDEGSVRLWDLETGETRAELDGHQGEVEFLDFDAAGDLLVSTSLDGTAQVYRADTGELVSAFTGHRDRVTGASFSADGDRVATSANDGTARIWDAETGDELLLLEGHDGYVIHADFYGDEVLTSGADGTARRWDARTGSPLAIKPASVGAAGRARFSPDGRRVAVPTRDGRITLWHTDVASHRVLEEHEQPVMSARFARGEDRLVTAGRDGAARIWDAANRELANELSHAEPLKGADLHVSRDRAATVGDSGRVTLWELGASPAAVELDEDDRFTNFARFSPDGSSLFIDGNRPSLWSVDGASLRFELDSGGSTLVGPEFTRDGERLVAGGSDGRVWVYDAGTGEVLQTLEGHRDWARAVGPAPSDEVLASVSRDGSARLWDLETGDELAVLTGHDGVVWHADFSPTGNIVATAGSDRRVGIWGARSGRKLALWRGHGRDVRSVSFSPDGRSLLTSSDDGTVRLWTVPGDAWLSEDVRGLRRCLPLELRDGNPAQRRRPGDC